MKSAIRHLADNAPAWFIVNNVTSAELAGRACVPKTPWTEGGLSLRIFGDPKPRVSEDIPGTALPARCPERHIQWDKSFCLGLRYMDVRSQSDAAQWWEQLRQFSSAKAWPNAPASGRRRTHSITAVRAIIMRRHWRWPLRLAWRRSTLRHD